MRSPSGSAVGGRQLRRLFEQHLGASPVAVAQTRRVLFAKQLLHETRLAHDARWRSAPASAACGASTRPSAPCFAGRRARCAARRRPTRTSGASPEVGVTLRLRYRPPYDWEAMLAHLASAGHRRGRAGRRANAYRARVSQDGLLGTVLVRHEPARNNLAVTVRFPCVRALPAILARVRRVFDVGADIETIGAHLSRDPFLRRLVAQRPGLRAPGGWDGFELAVRAVLGQQVSVAAARRLAGRLVEICGAALPECEGGKTPRCPAPSPRPSRWRRPTWEALGMPRVPPRDAQGAGRSGPRRPRPVPCFRQPWRRPSSACAPSAGSGSGRPSTSRCARCARPDAFPASDIGLLRARRHPSRRAADARGPCCGAPKPGGPGAPTPPSTSGRPTLRGIRTLAPALPWTPRKDAR